MKQTKIIVAAVTAFVLLLAWFTITGHRRGKADYAAALEGQPPTFATKVQYLKDGGSKVYLGRGYSVCSLHRYVWSDDNSRHIGFTGGAELKWGLLIGLFADDEASHHLIPSAK